MPLPREHISHNQIRIYSECPRKYQFLYLDGIIPPINDRILLGLAFHAAAAEYFRQKIASTVLSEDAVAEIFLSHFHTIRNEKEIAWKGSISECENRGLAFIRFFSRIIAPDIQPLICEKEYSAIVPGTHQLILKGIVDLIETDFTITDFKTTSSKWASTRVRHSLQMTIYRFLLEKIHGPVFSSIKYEIVYGRTPSAIHRQVLTYSPSQEDLQQMLEVVRHVAGRIDQGHFPKIVGHHCNFCDLKKHCRSATSS